MKIKAPQILGGIAALSFIFSNFLFVVNWIVEEYIADIWSFDFWIWPISFMIELAAISLFTFMFKNMSLRYIAVGVFLFARLIYSLYWMITYEATIGYFAGLFVGWPYWVGFRLSSLAAIFGFLSFILLVIAFILSFRYRSQTSSPTPGYSGNRTVPTITHTPPVQVKKAQGAYGDIEVLGDLLKKGLLTQEEFDLKKREILGLDK
jgi:hypothetical protein